MMKTILLIEPGANFTLYPPVGLMHIAAVLRSKYKVIIKDYSGKEIDEKQVERDITLANPFAVGIRVLTGPPIPRALKVSEIAHRKGAKVIWGGPHPTILPEQTLKNENIDAVVIGEGEYTSQKLLRHLDGEKVSLEGVGVKVKGKIKIFPPSNKYVNLDKLPLPAWDLVDDINRYFPNKRFNELPVSTTRGCPFKCGFCHNSNDNVKKYLGCYRIADPQRAIDEYKYVQSMVKNKIEILNVGEDLHLVSHEYTKKFCQAIKRSKLRIKWYTASRYQTLTDELIDMIADTGCINILLGVESGSERIQKMNNKIIYLDKARHFAKKLRARGIFVTNAYIIGHPTETEEELGKTVKFIKNIPADENLIQLYRPMPGTPYFQMCENLGKVNVPDKLEGWAGFGVLGHDTNVSNVPTKTLFATFFKMNAFEQTKYWFNQQRFFFRYGMTERFFRNFIENRFTFKLKQYLESKK